MLSLAREWSGLLSMDALISITGMLVCLFGLVRVIVAYSGTTRSAAPDPERVKRFIKSAPPIQAPQINDSLAPSPEGRRVRAQEAEPAEEDSKGQEAPR
ncbi:hypothetical protein NHU_00861 [Rhodovulum sulfidophilum]|uniref:Uncharacterized protein n=1 Tax=Rhodovulum sulfidophilum TaxID=35806 RepID=A0A0D6AZZ6_RHOSU|nr:hypothetical protein NHU_00861 [Rhodovulum sulfidophilum]